jgi:tetratricopeptide (TPR) repeat protein
VKARLELAHWLVQQGDAKALLAELIPLEEFAKSNPQIARELPELFERAGAASRAADAYRTLIEAHPNDAEAYAGLGRVELEEGNFHGARQALERAAELKPDDDALRREAEVAHLAVDLDPMSRRLSSGEKLDRSNRILRLAVDTFEPCGNEEIGSNPDSPLFQAAHKLITQKVAATNEAAEVRLDFATRIWNSRPAACNVAPDQEELVGLLVKKISQ